MNPLLLLDKLKLKIGSIGYRLFLWSIEMTPEQYWDAIYEQEAYHRKHGEIKDDEKLT